MPQRRLAKGSELLIPRVKGLLNIAHLSRTSDLWVEIGDIDELLSCPAIEKKLEHPLYLTT